MAAFVVGVLVWGVMAHGVPPFMVVLLAAGLVLLVVTWWLTSDAYRIGGRSAELRVYEEHIEIPGSRRGSVLRLPLAGLAFERVAVVSGVSLLGLLPIATFRRGELITLRSQGMTRTLSSLTSDDSDFADRLCSLILSKTMPGMDGEKLDAIFTQLFAGEAASRAMSTAENRSDDDAQLDKRIDDELAKLD